MPVATMGATVAAEEAARPLIRRWMQADAKERRDVERNLSEFSKRFEGDPLAQLVDVLAGWSALEQGDRVRAVSMATVALDGPPGVTRDLAALVVGASARRAGDSKRALDLLLPLLHKMVDPAATALLDEELVRTAILAAEWSMALRLMDVWIFEAAPAERERVHSVVASMFSDVPVPRLVEHLRARSSATLTGHREASGLSESLAQYLARQAVADRNVPLARMLLRDAGPLLGVSGEDVARLAGDRIRGRVTARTVGVLLALGSPMLERRSADVVTGLSFGMGIGDSDARLVSRDDGGDPSRVGRALAELAAEGAAVVVAGIDPRHDAVVAEFAEEQGLPVILLTASSRLVVAASTRTFVLGEPPARSTGALAAVLRSDGAKVVAGLGNVFDGASENAVDATGTGAEFSCDPVPTEAELRTERVDALVLGDGAYCGLEALGIARSSRLPLAVGLGSMTPAKLPDGSRIASVGIFPAALERGVSDPRLVGWFESRRPAPNWWMALGRDAAVLATSAVRELRDAASDDEVRARRIEAAAALGAARLDLWSTSAPGFDAARTVPREVVVRRVRGGKVVP